MTASSLEAGGTWLERLTAPSLPVRAAVGGRGRRQPGLETGGGSWAQWCPQGHSNKCHKHRGSGTQSHHLVVLSLEVHTSLSQVSWASGHQQVSQRCPGAGAGSPPPDPQCSLPSPCCAPARASHCSGLGTLGPDPVPILRPLAAPASSVTEQGLGSVCPGWLFWVGEDRLSCSHRVEGPRAPGAQGLEEKPGPS